MALTASQRRAVRQVYQVSQQYYQEVRDDALLYVTRYADSGTQPANTEAALQRAYADPHVTGGRNEAEARRRRDIIALIPDIWAEVSTRPPEETPPLEADARCRRIAFRRQLEEFRMIARYRFTESI